MQNNIFRKNSMEQMNSLEKLDEYIRITRSGLWSVLTGCLVLVIAMAVWTFYGNIPNMVEAKGILFPANGVTSVIPLVGGRITDMRVKVGDYVEAGQIIAVIPDDELVSSLVELRKDMTSESEEYKTLLSEYERKCLVLSPVSGIVLFAKSTNETVSSSDVIARIVKQEKYSDNRQIVTYIPSATARKLKEGMEVQVSPDFASREEYGYMYGHITSIGTYPVSEDDVIRSLGDMKYIETLLQDTDSVEIRVTLTVDPDSQSKIKWSNKKGESVPLSIGMKTDLFIVVKNYKPYELIFKGGLI